MDLVAVYNELRAIRRKAAMTGPTEWLFIIQISPQRTPRTSEPQRNATIRHKPNHPQDIS
jgi:hypothetical protein